MSFCSSDSLVGSYVWSHLTNVLRSEDPMKQALIESLPDDIISRDFEAEFLKYSSYADYTVSSGNSDFVSTFKLSIWIFKETNQIISLLITQIEGDDVFSGAVCVHGCVYFFCLFFRHWNYKCGNIFDFLPKIVSTEIRHCQPDSIFSW